MTIVAPVDGDLVDPQWADDVTDAINALDTDFGTIQSPPRAQIRQSSSQNLLNGTGTAVTFNVDDIDTANGHNTVTNNSRYVCQTPGDYLVFPSGGFAANTTGVRAVSVKVNGNDIAGSQTLWSASSSFATSMPGKGQLITMALNDYAEVFVIQTSGGTLATDVGTTTQSCVMFLLVAAA
jgi:hypothetical protein